jgi:two-component system, OmpR family, response regulator
MNVQRRILIVDSDPSAALVTQHGLQVLLGAGATVDLAPSPGAAWLRCVHDGVDLLIIDPSPRSRGAAALVKSLHDERPALAVLVLAAYDTPRLRAQMRALGVRHYLAKPVDLVDLGLAVSSVLDAQPFLRADRPHEPPVSPSTAAE